MGWGVAGVGADGGVVVMDRVGVMVGVPVVRVGVPVALREAVAVGMGVTLPVGAGVRVPGRGVGGGVRVKGVPVGATGVPVVVMVPVGVSGGVPVVVRVAVAVTVAVLVTVAVGVTVAVPVTVAVGVMVAVVVTVAVAVAGSDVVGVTVAVMPRLVVSGGAVVNGVVNGALTGMVAASGALPINVTGIMGGRSIRSPPSGRTWITQPATRMSKPIAASAVGRVSRFMKPPVAIKTLSSGKIVALSYH